MTRVLLLLLIASLAPVIAQAQDTDLYDGSVPVADQSQSEREAAFPAALEQVLGKLSGLRDFEAYPEVGEAVQSARSLVVSFHYVQVEASDDSPVQTSTAPPTAPKRTHLVARFSKPGVDDLMRVLGLPRWPPQRAPLSVWLLIDDGLSRRVMPLEYEYLRGPLDDVAEARGLPLSWPEAGEDGDFGADVQLLWGGYTETVSADGEPGEVLVIAARREGPEWNVRLILEYDGDHWTWRVRDIDLAQALTSAMHEVADAIAAAKAISPSDQGHWVYQISVGGLTSGDDYARCLAYLESLSVVDEVQVEGADARNVRLALSLNATPEHFEQILGDDGVLEYADISGHYVLQQ